MELQLSHLQSTSKQGWLNMSTEVGFAQALSQSPPLSLSIIRRLLPEQLHCPSKQSRNPLPRWHFLFSTTSKRIYEADFCVELAATVRPCRVPGKFCIENWGTPAANAPLPRRNPQSNEGRRASQSHLQKRS